MHINVFLSSCNIRYTYYHVFLSSCNSRYAFYNVFLNSCNSRYAYYYVRLRLELLSFMVTQRLASTE